MARGGIAGIWDRNKKWMAPVATGLAGLFNPLAGAAVGAAIGGLDRPGKSGVGLDVGGAVKGGIAGYGTGKLLQGAGISSAAKQGLKNVFTGGAKQAAGEAVGQAARQTATQAVGQAAGQTAGNVAGQAAKKTFGQAAGEYLKSKEGIAAIGGAAKGAAGMMAANQQAEMERQKYEDEQARLQRQAELMLMFMPQMQFGPGALSALGQYGGGMGGYRA